jgi:hypothetical protein
LCTALKESVELLRDLPGSRTLVPIFPADPAAGKILFSRHAANYYVIERNGFVPEAIPDLSNMLVGYRTRNPVVNTPTHVDEKALRLYDFVFVWGDNDAVASNLAALGFRPRKRNGFVATYQKNPDGLRN